MKKAVFLKAVPVCMAVLLAVVFCAGSAAAAVAGTERIAFTAVPSTADAGTTLTVPVTLSGYPRGLNQYVVEFTASAPNLTLADFAATLDKSMIQISTPANPVLNGSTVQRRYLQTVKMATYPAYGINETQVGTLSLKLPVSATDYDLVLSARIMESTSGAPLESLATPKTGDVVIHVAAAKTAAAKKKSASSPFPVIGILAAAGIIGIIRRRQL